MTKHRAGFRAAAAALALCLVGGRAPGATTVENAHYTDVFYTTNDTYSAAQIDVLIAEAGGSSADPELSSNLVASVVAEAGTLDAASELHRLILADLWRRVDALEGSDGSGYVTALQAEQLVEDRFEDEIAAWADTSGCLPIQATSTSSQTLSGNQSNVALALSPMRTTVLASNATNTRTLSFASVSGVGVNPCLLKLTGWKTVTWPSGTLVKTAYSYQASGNYFRVYNAAGTLVVERIYP